MIHEKILQVAEFTDHDANGKERTLLAYYDYEPETEDNYFTPGTDINVHIESVLLLSNGRKKEVYGFLKQQTIEDMENSIKEQIREK